MVVVLFGLLLLSLLGPLPGTTGPERLYDVSLGFGETSRADADFDVQGDRYEEKNEEGEMAFGREIVSAGITLR